MGEQWVSTIKVHFDAAHFLPHYVGPCANLHGHRWTVEVILINTELICDEVPGSEQGMIGDYKVLKDIIKSKLPDHQCLNDLSEYANPTAENIARILYHKLKIAIMWNYSLTTVKSVTVWETPDCGCTYSQE